MKRVDRKTPQEKKALSLARDRRNSYGQNDKASRRLVPRNRQSGQKRLRRAVSQRLHRPMALDEDSAVTVAADSADAYASTSRKRFKKSPDHQSLGDLVASRELEKFQDGAVEIVKTFCAGSKVLMQSDVAWNKTIKVGGIGPSTIELALVHEPTQTRVTRMLLPVRIQTRDEARRALVNLYRDALQALEANVHIRLTEGGDRRRRRP